jgi:hypothetical protein
MENILNIARKLLLPSLVQENTLHKMPITSDSKNANIKQQ